MVRSCSRARARAKRRRCRLCFLDGPCLFVTDAQVVALGLAEPFLAALRDSREVILFDAVEADPSRATLLAAVEAGKGVASVVGFGGGSPMDVARLAA